MRSTATTPAALLTPARAGLAAVCAHVSVQNGPTPGWLVLTVFRPYTGRRRLTAVAS